MAARADDLRPVPPPRRVPPHDLDAEQSLLGAMLLSHDAIVAAIEVVNEDDFYSPAHANVFGAIRNLYGRGEPADPVTVADELRRDNVLEAIGGPGILLKLQAAVPATGAAARYARIVEELSLLRRLIGVAGEISEMGYSLPDDVGAALDAAETKIFQVADRRVTDSTGNLRDLLSQSLDHLEALFERGDAITGVPTGFTDLDHRLAGLQPSNLVIVGARPGTGKTSFALGIASHAALTTQRPVLFFSLEMSKLEITNRLLCGEAKVDSTRMRNGRLLESDWSKISAAMGRLYEAQLYIDDNPMVTVMDVRAKARRLKSQLHDVGLVVVDYIQLMTGRHNAESRQVEVSEISRGLKILARELECPVIALSQLSRNLEQRGDKRPMLSDLRESGCMPASTRLLRADTGEEVTLGELVLTQETPLVWSVDERQRLVPARLMKAFPSGKKLVYRLQLASGRWVDASDNHRFLTVEGWVPLADLGIGCHIAVPRRLPAPTEPGHEWSNDELILLAHLLGDGSIGPSVKYATADPANKLAVEETARKLFKIEATSELRGRTWQMWLGSPFRLTHGVHHPVRNWLEPHGLWGSRAWTKHVPTPIFGVSDEQVALFLRHLWATDGSITLGRNSRGPLVRLYYSSTSEQLVQDVQMLLLRLGIRSTISISRKIRSGGGQYRPSYAVRIQSSSDQARFLRVVGCHGARGEVIPYALDILERVKENPNVDLVPWGIAGEVKAAIADAGITHRQIAEGLGEGYCGSYLLGTASRPRRFSRDRLRRIGEMTGSGYLQDVATSDLLWDEIVAIEPRGIEPTFDATVEGTHNFIANGIVAHNSLEQDADVVMFLYRDELYDQESPDKGVAEVIVAKHRAGPTGTCKLAFLDSYTKFANMAKL